MTTQPVPAERKNVVDELVVHVRRWAGLFGALGYFSLLVTFFFGSDNVYWYTMHNTAYGGSHAKEINEKFGTTLLNEHPREVRSTSGTYSYSSEDVDLRTLFIRNNSSHRIANSGDVRLMMCPLPQYFIISNYDFAVSRGNLLSEECGSVWNVRPIFPGHMSRVYFIAHEPPEIIEDSRSSSNLTSGERTLFWQLTVRGIMFFAAFALTISASSFVADFVAKAFLYVVNKIFKSNFKGGRFPRLIAFAIAIPGLGLALFWPKLALSEYELAGDYDKNPSVLLSQMQLVMPAQPKPKLIADARKEGKYEKAFLLQKSVVDETEKAETESIGKPGLATANALGTLAWGALLAQKYEEALAAAERGIALAPQETWIETNRAHALLLLGRVPEARAIYLVRMGTRLWGRVLWEDAIREDFATLKKVPIETSFFAEIETAMQQR